MRKHGESRPGSSPCEICGHATGETRLPNGILACRGCRGARVKKASGNDGAGIPASSLTTGAEEAAGILSGH